MNISKQIIGYLQSRELVLASIDWLAAEQEVKAPVSHCFAWACMDRGAVVSASEAVLLSGRREQIRRSVARRALPGTTTLRRFDSRAR